MKPAVPLLLMLPLACVTAQVPERDRHDIADRYTNQIRELPVSMYATTFFVENDRRLLSLQPPDEVDILDDTHGNPIVPGLAQEVIPAGTKVTIARIGFPSVKEDFVREFTTPRDRIWVDLAVDGKPMTPRYTLVLRPDLKTEAAVAAEIDKLLTNKSLDTEIAALSPADKTVITTKELAPGPTARGLELAFGTPVLKNIVGNGKDVVEDWTWRSDTISRSAHLKNGVVVSVDGPPVKHAALTQK